MGLWEKIKDTFIYEEEEENTNKEEQEEIKKEVIQVEIKAPIESEEEKKDYKVFFDEKDFEDLNKNEHIEYKKDLGEYKKEFKVNNKKEEDKKVFRPTPIISPVYGVLDKNYHKEDIVHKNEVPSSNKPNLTVDDIRNKAFGTLEDEIEKNMYDAKITIEEEVKLTGDIFEKIEEELDREVNKLDAFDELTKENRSYDNIMFQDLVPKKEEEELDYGELLNLTDDMYRKDDIDD